MGDAASSLGNAAQRSGSWCEHGRGPHFNVFALPCWIGLVPTQPWRRHFWAKFWMASGADAAVVSLHGGPHVLAEAFASYLGSGYQTKLIEYPTFDLRLMKRCLQRTASFVFGSLDPFSLTEFIVNRLKGAETRDWMASRPALRKAIITHDSSMPELVNVVANIVGVWPLIVSYLKETGRKDEGDSLVVRIFLVGICLLHQSVPITLCCF